MASLAQSPPRETTPTPVGLGSVEGRQNAQATMPKSDKGRSMPRPRWVLSSKEKERMPPSLPISRGKVSALITPQQQKQQQQSLSVPNKLGFQPGAQVGGRFSPLVDLPCEEKSSSDLFSHGPSQPDEARKPYDTNHVLAWRDPGLPTPVYVRMDSSGVFYTYPTLGDKPFQSLDEVQSAVASYACRIINVMPEPSSHKECVIRDRLFWPNGTRKFCTKAQVAIREREKLDRLVEALLDKQNDSENRVDELKSIVHWQTICEGAGEWYYHLNITVKTKGAADDAGNASLFFVEVVRDRNKVLGYYINTFFRVNTDSKDDEAICHGCRNNGSIDMKHPPAGSFKGGHMDIRFPLGFGACNDKRLRLIFDDAAQEAKDEILIKEKEKRIREQLNRFHDPVYVKKLCSKSLQFELRDYTPTLQEDEEITYKG